MKAKLWMSQMDGVMDVWGDWTSLLGHKQKKTTTTRKTSIPTLPVYGYYGRPGEAAAEYRSHSAAMKRWIWTIFLYVC